MTNVLKYFSNEEVKESCLKYFNGDELAANVALKYLLQDKNERFVEINPDDMHTRLAGEFRRIEATFGGNSLSFETIRKDLDHFKAIVPQGSPMFGIGNDFHTVSLSNCVVVKSPEDDMSSILD